MPQMSDDLILSKTRLAVGARVEGSPHGDGKIFPGLVTAVHGDGTASVSFIGMQQSSASNRSIVMEESALSPLLPMADGIQPSDLKPGLAVTAKWTGDGKWYAGRIDACGADLSMIKVCFVEYGNVETVPIEYLRRAAAAASTAAGSAPAPAAATGPDDDGDDDDGGDEPGKAGGIYAGLVIPDALRPFATDTAAERLRKKRKVRALKFAYRNKVNEANATSRASSWQQFQAAKKPLASGTSIFRTSDVDPTTVTGVSSANLSGVKRHR